MIALNKSVPLYRSNKQYIKFSPSYISCNLITLGLSTVLIILISYKRHLVSDGSFKISFLLNTLTAYCLLVWIFSTKNTLAKLPFPITLMVLKYDLNFVKMQYFFKILYHSFIVFSSLENNSSYVFFLMNLIPKCYWPSIIVLLVNFINAKLMSIKAISFSCSFFLQKMKLSCNSK